MRSRRSSALMAPARRKAAAGARGRKLSAFLKDFDREGRPRAGAPRPGPERRGRARAASDAASVPAVRSRVEQLRTNGERLVKEMENLYDVELLRLEGTPGRFTRGWRSAPGGRARRARDG